MRKLRRLLYPSPKPRILFGIDPLINNKYWANMLKDSGYLANSVVLGLFSINKRIDFDIVIGNKIIFAYHAIRSFYYYDVFCLSFNGGFLRNTPIAPLEPYCFKLLGIKSMILAYGSDISAYDLISKPFYFHVLNSFYPQSHKKNVAVKTNLERWQKHANFISSAMFFYQGLYRNDLISPNTLNFPVEKITPIRSKKNSKKICIVHSPNHRLIKGTEYIVSVIENLKLRYDIDFILLENKSNDEVLSILRYKADIFIEKLVGPSYALSAIEAMSYGVPVIGSIDNGDWDDLTKTLRRYSFLGECPIISASIETLEMRLEMLCSSKDIRDELSEKSREYVEKYHGYRAGRIVFEEILKYIYGRRSSLANFYHPLVGEYREIFKKKNDQPVDLTNQLWRSEN